MRGLLRMAECEKCPLTLALSPKWFAATLPSLAMCIHANNLGERGHVALSNSYRLTCLRSI
jgi:hypothetical protein